MNFDILDNDNTAEGHHPALIKVVGVGGGGGNAIKHMLTKEMEGVRFMVMNTDAQALKKLDVPSAMHIGQQLTRGLGAGANPEIGRQAAEEDRENIRRELEGADMVFVTAGMGGGTGTGAAPVVAEVAKEMGILTVAVVTRPFPFEGAKRSRAAEEGIRRLVQHVDSLITIPNEKLLNVLGKKTSLLEAFYAANDVLFGAVQGIADLITRPGLINVDFADVRTVMSEMGMAMMGTGTARGDNRAREAAESAINSPLLENVDLQGAGGILVNITGGMDMSLGEFGEVGEVIEGLMSEDATVVVGAVIDPEMQEDLRVTVIATGLGREQRTAKPRAGTVKLTERGHDGRVNYDQYDRPAVVRKRYTPDSPKSQAAVGDDLDIPAFLRRKVEAQEN